jgi:hypothetical protein
MGTARIPFGGGGRAIDHVHHILFRIILIYTLTFRMFPSFFQSIFFNPGGADAWLATVPPPQFVTKRPNFHLRL